MTNAENAGTAQREHVNQTEYENKQQASWLFYILVHTSN